MAQTDDLIGQVFTRLKVIERDSQAQKHPPKYICQCECGDQTSVSKYQLLSGKTKSCGCLQKEKVVQMNRGKKKINQYDLTSFDYGICYASNTGDKILFDKEDYDKIKGYCWRIDRYGYVVASAYNTMTGRYNKILKMHQFLMPSESGNVVDHKNGQKYDNQKSNLRICTQKNNAKNHRIYKNNTSGVSGVRWNAKNKNWRVFIGNINIGSFKDWDAAVAARKAAEEQYFGEYSYDNSRKDA